MSRSLHLSVAATLCLLAAACAAPTRPAATGPGERVLRPQASPTPRPKASGPTSPGTEGNYATPGPSTPAPTPVPSPGAVVYRPLKGEPAASGKTVLKGSIYRTDGTKAERGPKVTITGKGGGTLTVDVEAGTFEFPNVTPVGLAVSVSVDWYGMGPRTQTVSLTQGNVHVLNFGEPETETEAFALSSHPEISKVTPSATAKDVAGDKIALVLTVSEALTEVSAKNLASSLRLLPLNDTAVGGGAAPPDLSASGPADALKPVQTKPDAFPYFIRFFDWKTEAAKEVLTPKRFLEQEASTSLDAAVRNVSVNFGVPLLNNGLTPGRYQLALVHDPERPIKDVDGNLLGTDTTGKLNTQPAAGEFLNNVFLSPFIGPEAFKRDDMNTRWDSTHTNAVTFTLAPDKTPPSLAGAAVRVHTGEAGSQHKQGAGTYFEFTFSEPIVALASQGVSRDSLRDLANYTFAVGLNQEYLSSTALLSGGKKQGAAPLISLKTSVKNFGSAGDSELGKEFRLVEDPAAKVTVDISGLNRVTIHVANTELFHAPNAKALMTRVEGVHDPANNAIAATEADKPANQPRVLIAYPQTP
jgi:hypothetical protein